jgi:hypothetical protein
MRLRVEKRAVVRVPAVLALAASIASSCGASAPRYARLTVQAQPSNATVYVDDAFAGGVRALAVRPVLLRSEGTHFVTVVAPGYFPHDVELRAGPGPVTLRVRLDPIPP